MRKDAHVSLRLHDSRVVGASHNNLNFSHSLRRQMNEKSVSGSFWVVMKLCEWGSIEVMGMPLRSPAKGGAQHFLRVFDTREEAVKEAGSDRLVIEVLSVLESPPPSPDSGNPQDVPKKPKTKRTVSKQRRDK
jgi:hypothetical protein